jgi:hypothetical protein
VTARYWRGFTVDPQGVLVSSTRVSPFTDGRFPTRRTIARPCPVEWAEVEHAPAVRPFAGCRCGLYVWTGWRHRWMCQRIAAPRIIAEVAVDGPVEASDGHCPLYPTRSSARVYAFELLALWLPGERHCLSCVADDDQHDATGEDLAALGDRYGVPVGRL